MVFSGALWKIRSLILRTPLLSTVDVESYDRIILRAMTLGSPTDMFASQFHIILGLISNHSKLNVLLASATSEFSSRVFNCVPITNLPESGDGTYFLPDARITTTNLGTTPTQWVINLRASDWAAEMRYWMIYGSWTQWFSSDFLGNLYTGYGSSILKFATSNCHILLVPGKDGVIYPIGNCSTGNESLTWINSTHNSATNTGSIKLPNHRVMYVQLVSEIPASLVLYSSRLVFYGFNRIWRFLFVILGALSGLFLLLFTTFIIYSRYNDVAKQWVSKRPARSVDLACVTFIFQCSSGVFALFALLFPKVRELLTMVAFLMLIPIFLFDLAYIYFGPVIEFAMPLLPFKQWFLFTSSLCFISGMVGLAIVIATETSIVLHAIVFSTYVVLTLLRILVMSVGLFSDYGKDKSLRLLENTALNDLS